MRYLAALLLSVALTACASPAPTPSPTPPPVPTATASPSPSPTELPAPSASITCVQQITAGSAVPAGDPCVSAIPAVRAVVAPLGLPIASMYIGSGTFDCGVVWPGIESMPACSEPAFLPGSAMHGWVAFTGTAKVAAIQLTRVPLQGATQSGPWQARIVTFVVPPTGWTMP